MAPASNEEQFKFLISCIRYSNNGKVDFGQVATECKIVSKGAAAKRYERMMRAHGIASTATSVKPFPVRTSKPETSRESSSGPISKKRKADQFVEENTTADDDEGFGTAAVKPEPIDKKEHLRVKEEDGRLSMDDAANLMQYYDTQPYPSSLGDGGETSYGGSDYDGATSGYHTPLGGNYALQAGHSGDYYSPYAAAAGVSSVCRFVGQNAAYQSPYTPIVTDGQGGSESPVIVE